jgi:hypothetical protein
MSPARAGVSAVAINSDVIRAPAKANVFMAVLPSDRRGVRGAFASFIVVACEAALARMRLVDRTSPIRRAKRSPAFARRSIFIEAWLYGQAR